MLKEFKAFVMRGNVLDLAVGIIIGGAFGTIVKSLVDDVIMPPIGLALGNVDFSGCEQHYLHRRRLEHRLLEPLRRRHPDARAR